MIKRIVILEESHRNWILDATFTESAEAIGISIEKLFCSTSKVKLQRYFVLKKIKKLSKLESTKMWLASHRVLEKFGGFLPLDCFLPKKSRVLITHLSDEDSDSKLFYNLRDFEIVNQPSLMRSANLYLSLSEVEGGPFPTLEALASGTPVVVTNVGWNSEYVKNGIGLILERDATLDDITSAIKNYFALKETVMYKDLIPGEALWYQLGEKLYG